MAYRKVHDSFWTDPDIEELTPEKKYFYLYLITNPNVNQIGLYELSVRRVCFETGYNRDTVEKLLDYFESEGKIIRSKDTNEILVVKFWHHNQSSSPKVQTHVKGLLDEVKDRSLIPKIYSIDTVSYSIDTLSQEEEEQEEEQEEVNWQIDYSGFVDFWNNQNDCNLRVTDKKRTSIRARLRTFKGHEIKEAIRNRAKDPWINGEGKKYKTDWMSFWRNDEKVERYLHANHQEEEMAGNKLRGL